MPQSQTADQTKQRNSEDKTQNTYIHNTIKVKHIYFMHSSEFNAYKMGIKVIFSTVKIYCINSLVSDTIDSQTWFFDHSKTGIFPTGLSEWYLSEITLRML